VKRHAFWIIALGILAGVGAWTYYRLNRAPAAPTFTTSAVLRGDIVETVDATGKLQAVTTVQVGTQVSGTSTAGSGAARWWQSSTRRSSRPRSNRRARR
jgi:multidrug efflux pump subunit AcrA (membrane-fusion protein)